LAIAGPVADWLGVQAWFIIGGTLCMVWGVGMLMTPVVMNIEVHGRAVQEAAERSAAPAPMPEGIE
jgi:hypothetical protein